MKNDNDNFDFIVKSFEQLSIHELNDIFVLRQKVFVVEQECAYLDADGLDEKAIHIFQRSADMKLIAYLRLLPGGISYQDHPAIGRVVVDENYRGLGLGRKIMKYALQLAKDKFPDQQIKISAQLYLKAFYDSLGFRQTGEPYLEDGIPHVAMISQA